RPTTHPDPRSFPTRRSSDLGGLISHGLQFLDILDLYDEGSLFGIKNGDLRIKESVFDGTLEEYRINPTPENGFDGGANSLRRERSEEHTSELQSRENLVCRL